jgi:hypothetical protein
VFYTTSTFNLEPILDTTLDILESILNLSEIPCRPCSLQWLKFNLIEFPIKINLLFVE